MRRGMWAATLSVAALLPFGARGADLTSLDLSSLLSSFGSLTGGTTLPTNWVAPSTTSGSGIAFTPPPDLLAQFATLAAGGSATSPDLFSQITQIASLFPAGTTTLPSQDYLNQLIAQVPPEYLPLISPELLKQASDLFASGNTLAPTDFLTQFSNIIAQLGAQVPLVPPTEMVFGPGGWQYGVYASVDSDGDGFLDAVEAAVGTSFKDKLSTPFSGKLAGAVKELNLSKMDIKLNFAKASGDSISMSGVLPAPDGLSLKGQLVVIYVGGIAKAFSLDEHGKSIPSGKDKLTVSKPRKGECKFKAKLVFGDFAQSLANDGLSDVTAKGEAKTIPVQVLFNETVFKKDQSQLYDAKSGKFGHTKMPRL